MKKTLLFLIIFSIFYPRFIIAQNQTTFTDSTGQQKLFLQDTTVVDGFQTLKKFGEGIFQYYNCDDLYKMWDQYVYLFYTNDLKKNKILLSKDMLTSYKNFSINVTSPDKLDSTQTIQSKEYPKKYYFAVTNNVKLLQADKRVIDKKVGEINNNSVILMKPVYQAKNILPKDWIKDLISQYFKEEIRFCWDKVTAINRPTFKADVYLKNVSFQSFKTANFLNLTDKGITKYVAREKDPSTQQQNSAIVFESQDKASNIAFRYLETPSPFIVFHNDTNEVYYVDRTNITVQDNMILKNQLFKTTLNTQ